MSDTPDKTAVADDPLTLDKAPNDDSAAVAEPSEDVSVDEPPASASGLDDTGFASARPDTPEDAATLPADPAAPPPPALPPPDDRPFRSAMLERSRGLFRLLGGRVFGRVTLDDAAAERLRDLGEQGRVVYVMRTRSTLDYLLFNHLFLQVGAPLARFANGVNTLFFRSAGRWLVDRVRRLFGKRAEPDPLEQLDTVVREGGAALLFMKVRQLTAERQASPGFIERLVELQRALDAPIMLVPQHISWPRKPPSKRRSWLDILFGDREASGKLRKLVYVIRFGKHSSVQVGEPIDLAAVIADHPGWSDARIARKLKRVLYIHLAREQMAITGPAMKPASQLRREILERRAFRHEVEALAPELGLRPEAALDAARKNLKEIAANINYEVLLANGRLLDPIFDRVFEGVEVDAEGMRRVKEAARHSRRAPLVLVPCHKSHFDYLVISWVFLRNEFIPPHVAAGANLSFFPLGSLFRRSGAFFLRRSFAGQPLYKLTFRQYLWTLVREGYPIEFFMEGGRSRTGKLLPPKLGMMSMLLEGVRRGEFKDLQFVPIHLSYEKVVETASYRRELTGGEKEAESVAGVVKASKVLRARYGRIYVSFEEPVRLTDYLARHDTALAGCDEPTLRDTTYRLSYHLMRRIQEATVVAPSSLVGAVLLSHHRRGLTQSRLGELTGYLVGLLQQRGARLSASIAHLLDRNAGRIAAADARSPRAGARARGEALRPLINEALALLRKLVDLHERQSDAVWVVPDKARIELDYYRNAILGILAPDCLIATALLGAERALTRDRLAADTRKLSQLFKREFIYRTELTYEEAFAETFDRMVDEGLVALLDDDLVVPAAPLTLDFLRGMLLHLVEGYWLAADALRVLVDAPIEKKDWVDYAREHGEMEFLQGDVRRAESASTAVLQNALDLFAEEGLVEKRTRPGRGKPTTVYALSEGRVLEDIALRRDDIGVYLLRAHDDRLRREATDEAPAAVSPSDLLRALPEYAEDPLDDVLVTGRPVSQPPVAASPRQEIDPTADAIDEGTDAPPLAGDSSIDALIGTLSPKAARPPIGGTDEYSLDALDAAEGRERRRPKTPTWAPKRPEPEDD